MATHAGEHDARLAGDALRLHALKNCAATISVLSRLLANVAGADRRRHLDRLQETAARMTALLAGSLERSTASLEVAELLETVREEAEPKAQEGHVNLSFSHIPASVRGSSQELREALLNIVHNAIEATPPGGHVCVIHTADEAGAQSFAIRDEGPGICPELTRDAGKRRVRSSKPDGSGVGLVLARRVVENQGGTLDVVSSTQGTTIRVRLPAA